MRGILAPAASSARKPVPIHIWSRPILAARQAGTVRLLALAFLWPLPARECATPPPPDISISASLAASPILAAGKGCVACIVRLEVAN